MDSLLIQADRAAPSLKVLPRLVEACSTGRYSTFVEALELARATGAVWAQVTALAWMTAINPTEWSARSLVRLIAVTGWRRMVLVPPEIAADAALGITSLSLRHPSVIDLASVSSRPNVAAQVAAEHLADATLEQETHAVAIRCLVRLGTARARQLLQEYSMKRDLIGEMARGALSRPARVPISEREAEVLHLAARGLTNKEIGAHLTLSEHTIARHIANARSKLGAANRAEAVSRLAEMSRS